MRCPYCNGFNQDDKVYCTYCGRDMRIPTRPAAGQYPPVQQPRAAPQAPPAPPQARQAASPQAPTYPPQRQAQAGQPARPMPPGQPAQAPRPAPQGAAPSPTQARPQTRPGVEPAPLAAPDPPGPFPPRTLAELQALEQGALAYTVLESGTSVGRKKIVRIVYPKGAPWQQVATLLKALKEQQDPQFESIVIQGQTDQRASLYAFTNGQLVFDRDVRLGAAITNRYLFETGNGFDSDALRIVLNV
ncbi:MAG TPA: hypothetical protein VGT44_03905 [Ktedonobacteraceae bacterium]|nr:hypothetical protein [Ktedonobacteraceae bacterium]